MAVIPSSVSDVLLHTKDTDRTERVIMPFTRYDNVFSAPNIVRDADSHYGAPFHLLEVKTEKISRKTLINISGRSII